MIDLGGRRLRFLMTPHVPHSWESGTWYDETDGTLFAGDLFTTVGAAEPLVTEDLIDGAARRRGDVPVDVDGSRPGSARCTGSLTWNRRRWR